MPYPVALSTELGLLAACDLATDQMLRDKLARAQAGGIDWNRFANLAEGNGIAGLAVARLARVAGDVAPAEVAGRFAGLERAGAITHMVQARLSVRLTRLLAGHGVRSIVLKGQALSNMLYRPSPHWRGSSDIDLLIPSQSLAQADALLRSEGFIRQWPEQDPPDRGRDMFLLLANVFEYICPDSGQLIELHHRITLNPWWLPGGIAAIEQTAAEIDTGQGTVRGLDGPILVAYLSWHAFSHFNFRLKWICDIARALRHMGASSCTALCPPQAGYAQAPLELADALLAVILPAACGTEQKAGQGRWRRQIGKIIAGMEAPERFPTSRSLASLPAEFGFRLFLARLSPGWKGKGYELLRGLCDPRDVKALGLGAGFAPLYALAGPLLALNRLAFRPSS